MPKKNQTQLEHQLLLEKIDSRLQEIGSFSVPMKKTLWGKEVPDVSPQQLHKLMEQNELYHTQILTLKEENKILQSKLQTMNSKSYVAENRRLLQENQMLMEQLNNEKVRNQNLMDSFKVLAQQQKQSAVSSSSEIKATPPSDLPDRQRETESLHPMRESALSQEKTNSEDSSTSPNEPSVSTTRSNPKNVYQHRKKMLFLYLQIEGRGSSHEVLTGMELMDQTGQILYQVDSRLSSKPEVPMAPASMVDLEKRLFVDRQKLVSIIKRFDRLVSFDTEHNLKLLFNRLIAFQDIECFDIRFAFLKVAKNLDPRLGRVELPHRISDLKIDHLAQLPLGLDSSSLSTLERETLILQHAFYFLQVRFASFDSFWNLGKLKPYRELLNLWFASRQQEGDAQ